MPERFRRGSIPRQAQTAARRSGRKIWEMDIKISEATKVANNKKAGTATYTHPAIEGEVEVCKSPTGRLFCRHFRPDGTSSSDVKIV